MNPIRLYRIQRKRWSVFFIVMVLATVFNDSDASSAAKETTEDIKIPKVELAFSGIGLQETEPFTVTDGWKIQWETESPSFKLSAHGTAQRPYIGSTNEREKILQWFESVQPIVLANTNDSKGEAFHPFGGTFYLKIVADGPWRIYLKTKPDTKDYLDVPYTGAP